MECIDTLILIAYLPIVARRTVQLGRIDPVEARELFLRHALIEGDWPFSIRGNGLYDFDRANRALRAELEEVEERTRRRDILADDEAVIEFYDARIPREITDVRAFPMAIPTLADCVPSRR